MLIRILTLVLLVSSCSGTTTSTTPDSNEKEKQKELKFIFKSQADAALHVKKVLTGTPYPLSDEQGVAIDSLAANYTVESLNEGKETRSQLRKDINRLLLPEQEKAWLEYSRKKKRSVIIQ